MRAAVALACLGALMLCAPPAAAGTPWKLIGSPKPLASVAFAPSPGSSRVYAQTDQHWWRSDDAGTTWATVGPATSTVDCHLGVSPRDPDMVYSGCGRVSDDGGLHWFALPTLTGAVQIDAAGTLYGKNERGSLQRCTPDGFSCSDLLAGDFYRLIVDPASTGLLARQSFDGLTVSTDGGITWSAPRALPAQFRSDGMAFDGRVPGKLILVGIGDVQNRLMAVSPNAGLTWGPVRSVPLPYDQAETVQAGGSGAARRIWIQTGNDAEWTGDDGATFHPAQAANAGRLTVDPNDGAHLFAGDDLSSLWESHDAGATWTMRNSTRFGVAPFYRISGSGSILYGISNWWVAWYSHDGGLTWARAPALAGWQVQVMTASPDDPRVAYAAGARGSSGIFAQTVDGGQTWSERSQPPGGFGVAAWVERGHPDWVFSNSVYSQPLQGSHDGGRTWAEEPRTGICGIGVAFTPGDSAHGQAACGGYFALDPARAPWDQTYGAAEYVLTDHTGSGSMYATEPVGRVNGDWSFDVYCVPISKSYCRALYSSSLIYGSQADAEPGAWVAGGHATFAAAISSSGLWAMRDGGRWWQIPAPPGSDGGTAYPPPLVMLSDTYLIAGGLLVRLEAPDAGAPALTVSGDTAHCSTTLTSAAADIAWSWRRDGAVIAGGTAADHAIVPGDRGHALACVLTASNAWGSSASSSDAYRVPGAAGAAARLTLTGIAAAGNLLRCGAARTDWLRSGRALKGHHARSYLVRVSDEGHVLACQARQADGTALRSAALRVPRSRGARAIVTP